MIVSCHSYFCIDLVLSAHRKPPLDVAETHCHSPSWFSRWSARSFSTYTHLPASLSSTLTLTNLLIGVSLHLIRTTNPSMLRFRLWKVRLFAICNLRLGSASGSPSNTCFPCFSDSENSATPHGSCTGCYPVSGPQPSSATAPRLPHRPCHSSRSDLLTTHFSVFVIVWLFYSVVSVHHSILHVHSVSLEHLSSDYGTVQGASTS